MYDTHLNSKGTLRPITVTLRAVQFVALDPENTDLVHELIAWTSETATRASAA